MSAAASTPADQVDRGNHRIAAMLGQNGCAALPEDEVVIVPHGFLIHRLKEFVPYDDTAPSPDGRYWRCTAGGQRTKFLAPDDQ
jgi:hypothetical protein